MSNMCWHAFEHSLLGKTRIWLKETEKNKKIFNFHCSSSNISSTTTSNSSWYENMRRDELRGEVETLISFECFQTMMKHVEGVFHMTRQTNGQTRE